MLTFYLKLMEMYGNVSEHIYYNYIVNTSIKPNILHIYACSVLSYSSAKDLFAFHGINTDVVQSGVESISKCLLNIPWKFSIKMNVKSMKFQLDTPPWKTRTEILSVKYVFFYLYMHIIHFSLFVHSDAVY